MVSLLDSTWFQIGRRPRLALLIKISLCIIGLGVAHLISFHRHYAGISTFPDDFIGSYHAMAYQWYRDNTFFYVIPWVPYGNYGFPAFLALQNSAFYWPLQISTWLSIPYSYETATRLQLLHVLIGSCGTLVFFRNYSRSWLICFIAAAAYMFSGAFYGNAQHVDTVRAYALAPCVLAVMTHSWLGVFSPIRIAVTSLIASLFLIGGYPGNVIALFYVLMILVPFELLRCADWKCRNVYLLQAAAAWFIVIIVSGVKYGEPLLNLHEFQYSTTSKLDFSPILLLTLILPFEFDQLPNDLSMRSLYISPFLLVMVLFAPIRALTVRMGTAFIVLFVFMTLHEPFWKPALKWVPGLSFSRNSLADFRPAFQLGVILISVAALEHWRHASVAGRRWLRLMVAFGLVLAILAWGWSSGYSVKQLAAGGVPAGAALLIAVLFVYAHTPVLRTGALLCAAAAVCASGIIFFNQQEHTWLFSPIRSTMTGALAWDVNQLDELNMRRTSWTSRPERPITDAGPNSLRGNRGLYSQEFTVGGNDIGSRLRRNLNVRQLIHDPNQLHLLAFMGLPSSTWVFYDKPVVSLEDLRRCREATACAPGPGDKVVMTKMLADGAYYSVTLSKPAVVVENEIFFPRWQGRICQHDLCNGQFPAIQAGELLRSWSLPAGTYELRIQYVEPFALIWILMFWLGHGIMVGLIVWGLVRNSSKHSRPR